MNLTAETPHLFFSKILMHGFFILMSQIRVVASLEPVAKMLPSN